MLRSWLVVVMVLVVGACSGKGRIDRAKVDAAVKKGDACKDEACLTDALGEIGAALVEADHGKGVAAEDIELVTAAQKVLDAKIAVVRAAAPAH